MTSLSALYQIAEEKDIAVDFVELEKREAFSIMDNDLDCFIAIDPNKLAGEEDERLKLAHELGHCETGALYNIYATCDVWKKHENRADRWAIESLIPLDEFDQAITDGCTEIWSLAEYFRVPAIFMQKVICWYVHGNLDVDHCAFI